MSEPQVKNSSDPAQIERARQRDKRREERNQDDIKWLLSDPRGRRFYHRYMVDVCGIFKLSFDNSGSITSLREGQRNVGLKLWAELNVVAPDIYPVMLKESKENENV